MMRELIKSILMFFCRDVGELSVEKDVRPAFLIQSNIMQVTHKQSRGDR